MLITRTRGTRGVGEIRYTIIHRPALLLGPSFSHIGLPIHFVIAVNEILKVRQWPGNGGDLDFRGVIRGCAALIVATTPISGTISKSIDNYANLTKFKESTEYAAIVSRLPFCRLWCIGKNDAYKHLTESRQKVVPAVELYAAISSNKPIIFRCAKAEPIGDIVTVNTEEGAQMLENCHLLVDVDRAECAVRADKVRELKAIIDRAALNRAVSAATLAGGFAIASGIAEVDAYACGECEPLRALPQDRIVNAIKAAASGGHLGALVELLARLPDGEYSEELSHACFGAATTGHTEALVLLRDGGALFNYENEVTFPRLLRKSEHREQIAFAYLTLRYLTL